MAAFFDPKDDSVTTPPVSVSARSWKMNEETKNWVLGGDDGLNQASLLDLIEVAEVQKRTHYTRRSGTGGEVSTRSSTGW